MPIASKYMAKNRLDSAPMVVPMVPPSRPASRASRQRDGRGLGGGPADAPPEVLSDDTVASPGRIEAQSERPPWRSVTTPSACASVRESSAAKKKSPIAMPSMQLGSSRIRSAQAMLWHGSEEAEHRPRRHEDFHRHHETH